MTENRANYVIRNLISSLANTVVGTIFPFLVRTVTIKYLGSECMGLNNLCTSILYVLNAADLGIANAFAYRLYKPVAEQNTEEICRLLNLYRKVYFAIGTFIFFAGMCLIPFLNCFISQDLPDGINIYFVYFLYLLNSAISYMTFAYKNLIFTATQRRDYSSIITTICFLVLYGTQIVFIITGHYYFSVCMLPICTILENIIRNMVAKRKYPLYFPKGNVSLEVKRSIKSDVLAVAVYKFRDISRNTFDSIVISTFAGLVTLSNYQNYYTIFSVPNLLFQIVYGSTVPSMGNFVATESVNDTYKVYKKNIFIQTFFAGWFAICYGFLIQDFIVIWLGSEYRLSNLLALFFAIYIYLTGENYVVRLIRESAGLWNYGRRCAVVEMILNLVLNVVFMKIFGVEGIILATITSMLLVTIPMENYIVYKHYFMGKFTDRCKMAGANMMWLVITALLVWGLLQFTPDIYVLSFCYKVFVCMIIPPITLIVGFHQTEEFRYIKHVIMERVYSNRKK